MMLKVRQFFKSAFSHGTIIPWMMIVAIIPIIVISFVSYDIAKKVLQDAISHALVSSIQKKIEVIDSYITERKLDLTQISELPTLHDVINVSEKNGKTDLVDQHAMTVLTNYLNYLAGKIGITNVYLINAEGKVIYTLKQSPALGVTLTADNSMYKELYRAFDGARVLRIPYVFGNFKEKRRVGSDIYLSNVVVEGGATKAILVMEIDTDEIDHVIDRILGYGRSEETLLAALVNDQAVVVMHTKQDETEDILLLKNKEILDLLGRAIRGESSMPIELQGSDKKALAVYRYVPQLNMGMLVQFDKTEVFEKIHWLKVRMLMFIGIGLLFVIAVVFWISRALWKANEKGERLLENILPKFVIEELKEKKQFAARNVHNASVIFVDIADFTSFASSRPPETVVRILDQIFTMFDQLCDKHGLMKIKTIGDAYMAAAGMTADHEDHAQRTVDLGIDIILAIQHYNLNHHTHFSVRVGIDSGTVSAGIIGKQKFSYDVWGNAVNRASRMQSTGVKNKIQITQDTYNCLTNKDKYIITLREHVAVKGLGEMNTYLVEEKEEESEGL